MAIFNVTNTNDSGTGSLRQAIVDANANLGADTINFDASLNGKTILLTTGEIEVKDDVTIEGLGKDVISIDGGGNNRIFRLYSTSVKPNSLTVKNLSLTNGFATPTKAMPNAARGGAIATEHQGVLTVEGVKFIGNVADDGGGAIYSWFEGTLTVIDSEFIENKAIVGNDERGAGAIAFHGPGQLTVTNSKFINNKGINGAAINNLTGRVTIENSSFIGNDVLAATFDTGESNDFLRGYGGAIYSDRLSPSNAATGGVLKIKNSIFEDNQGKAAGGAVYIFTGGKDRVEVQTSAFRNNQVIGLEGGEKGNSGAIELQSNQINQGFVIVNSEFSGNRAVDRGGAIRTRNAPTTIINSTFSDNATTMTPSASFTGGVGGALELGGSVDAKITNSTFDNNFAMWVGGAIGGGAKIEVNNSIFYNNFAANGTNNWGIQQHTIPGLSGANNIQFPDNGNGTEVTPGILTVDPLLGILTNNGGMTKTRELLSGSPAINAGDNNLIGADIFDLDNDGNITEAIAVDQRGIGWGRVVNNTVDIGAYEVNSTNGTSGNDSLTGTENNDNINGLAGNDTIKSLQGNDTLIGGEDQDKLYGQDGNDFLQGDGGNDLLDGGAGADTIQGGSGNDIYIVESSNDSILENPGEGNDLVKSSQNYILGLNVERLFLTGSLNLEGVGNNGNNIIQGNNGNNLLQGLTGKDQLFGQNGSDTLIGGKGNDQLTGGSQNDDFIFNSSSEKLDIITDFNKLVGEGDRLLISAKGFGGNLIANNILPTEQFIVGTAATNSNHRFIYNNQNTNGELFYDSDGIGGKTQINIATLIGAPALSNNDIYIF